MPDPSGEIRTNDGRNEPNPSTTRNCLNRLRRNRFRSTCLLHRQDGCRVRKGANHDALVPRTGSRCLPGRRYLTVDAPDMQHYRRSDVRVGDHPGVGLKRLPGRTAASSWFQAPLVSSVIEAPARAAAKRRSSAVVHHKASLLS